MSNERRWLFFLFFNSTNKLEFDVSRRRMHDFLHAPSFDKQQQTQGWK